MSHRYRLLAVILSLSITACGSQALSKKGGIEISDQSPILSCEQTMLNPEIEALIKPILTARAKNQLDVSEFALVQLLGSSDPNALEAQVALMAYYVGEDTGQSLVESVVAKGAVADTLVQGYESCRPKVSFETELSGVVAQKTLYQSYKTARNQ